MATAELRWPPAPHRAGFTITDDTDAATFEAVRAVYDVLDEHGVRVTKTVWAFPPVEPCGIPALPPSILRGVTLADRDYRAYCERLAAHGFEITLHGATAGNNRRETIERAFAELDRSFPRAATYICHAKNADNPYWQEKVVASGPLRWALARYAKGHHCYGEDPTSPYFWGDICHERVRYIRLFRTRNVNVLADNPSMPYYEREKPYVRGWFSACKRSFAAVTQEQALAGLERDWGMCVLYQYMHRWGDPATGSASPALVEGARRLAAHPAIWCDTATALLDRLRLLHGVFLGSHGRTLWLVNTNDRPVDRLQIETGARPARATEGVSVSGNVLVVERLAAGATLRLECDRAVEAHGRTAVRLDDAGRGQASFGHGEVWFAAGDQPWTIHGIHVPARGHVLRFERGLAATAPRSRAADHELTSLFCLQAAIVGREMLLKGRHVDSNRWLGSDKITLENHDTWE
jgi:hypothetical protein